MKKIQLNNGVKISSRAKAVIDCIASMIKPDVPLEDQHDIKFLWHSENLRKFLNGFPYDAIPITMEIDPALDCNYSCPHCTYSQWKYSTKMLKGKRIMKKTDMELILSRVANAGVKGLIFTGGGEPFMNPYTPFGIKLAGELGIQTGIFTNGSLLTNEIIDQILSSQPEFMRISVNAVTPAVYKRFHGIKDDHFVQIVWENVEKIANRINKEKTNFGLGIVVNNINCQDIVPVIIRSLEIIANGGRIDYIAIRPVVNYWGQKQIAREIASIVKQAQEYCIKLIEGSTLKLFFANEFFEEITMYKTQNRKESEVKCLGSPWMASIAYSGDVFLCSEYKGFPENRIGNLITQSMSEIWSSDLRMQVISNNCKKPPVCKAFRLNSRMARITECGTLDDSEIKQVESFLNKVLKSGEPGGVNFL